jgi:NDP-sugar pyrophosphorylase family protein
MRASLLVTVFSVCVLSSVTSSPALAADPEDTCKVEAGPRDVVKKRGDVVISPGQDVEQVIALNGNVTIKKGASVKGVMAAHGNVTVEGEVREGVLVVGGHVVLKGGVVGGGQVVLDGKQTALKGGEEQKALSGDLVVDGQSLSGLLATRMLEKLDGCHVTER